VTFWCELAWLGGDRVETGALVNVENGRIASVELGLARPPADATRLDGVTIPGLANAHSHAFQRALRGRAQAERGSFWSWRERMYEVAARLHPDSYLKLARGTFTEMARAGITVVGEFHYLHRDPVGTPYADPNAMGKAVIEAASQVGIRITLLDACYLHGGIGEPLAPEQVRFSDGDAGGWIERVDQLEDGPRVRIGAAIHSVRAVDPGAAGRIAAWAGERPLHAHVSEQPAENEACIAAYGATPTEVLADEGALDRRFTAIHATHVSDRDIELLGSGGCTVCLCPTTERDLADGVGPARRLHDAGATLALGSDSNAIIDPFEEARAVELDERLVSGQRGIHRPADLLNHATGGGYAALGWDAAGFEPGMLADLVTVGLDSVRLAGADRGQLPAALVFSATAADVRNVIVGGELVVREGALQ
jgi:formiminoglutamate deiminase